MSKKNRCEFCQQEVSISENGDTFRYDNRVGCVCDKCGKALSSFFIKDTPHDEKETVYNYFRSLLKAGTPTSLGELYIMRELSMNSGPSDRTNGPFDESADTANELKKEERSSSQFGIFLKVLGCLVWLGGLIIAISGGYVTISMRYGNYTEFSFSQFLPIFIPYLIYGIILWGLGSMANQIYETNRKMNDLVETLKKRK